MSLSISRTNLRFPWRLVKSGFHCSSFLTCPQGSSTLLTLSACTVVNSSLYSSKNAKYFYVYNVKVVAKDLSNFPRHHMNSSALPYVNPQYHQLPTFNLTQKFTTIGFASNSPSSLTSSFAYPNAHQHLPAGFTCPAPDPSPPSFRSGGQQQIPSSQNLFMSSFERDLNLGNQEDAPSGTPTTESLLLLAISSTAASQSHFLLSLTLISCIPNGDCVPVPMVFI